MTTDPTLEDTAFEVRLLTHLHGEETAAERRATRALLARDADARERLAVLAALDGALAEALDAVPAPRRGRFAFLRGGLVRGLVAAAAALAVVVAWEGRGENGDAAFARNDVVELRVAPVGGGSLPLFGDHALELHWRARRGPLRIVPASVLGMPKRYRDLMLPATGGGASDLAIACTVRAPDGRELQAIVHQETLTVQDAAVQTIRLRDLELRDGHFGLAFPAGRPGAPGEGWTEDFVWPLDALPTGNQLEDRQPRLFPTQTGTWRFTFTVDALAAGQRFAEPLVARVEVLFTARVGAWSEPHDGIRVRLLFADDAVPVGRRPLALQIENVSGRARRYNLAGVTQVEIAQPMHQTLLVDGEPWQQRDDLAFVVGPHNLDVEHPPGGIHTVVVMADYWRRDGRRLGELPGAHRLQLALHSKMLVWDPADAGLWQGDVVTPALDLRVPAPR